MVGTGGYLAPEVVQSLGHGRPFDYYCFGCLLYVLLTGCLPHYTGDFQAMMRQRVQGSAPKYPNWVNADARDVINQLLDSDPTKRLTTAKQLRHHAWFQEVKWDLVFAKEWRAPPIDPTYNQRHGIANFSSEFTRETVPNTLAGFKSVVTGPGQPSRYPGY